MRRTLIVFSLTWVFFFGYLLVLSGCGRIEHTGTVTAKIQVDDTMLNNYFARHCCRNALNDPTDSQIASCAATPTKAISDCSKNLTADFLAVMTSLLPTDEMTP